MMRKLFCLAFQAARMLALVLALLWAFTGQAILARAQTVPPGFRLIAEQPGVALYQKDYAGGTPDYVQVVHLASGASVSLLHGRPVDRSGQRNQGEFGGDNPSFDQIPIASFWSAYSQQQPAAFCVTNAQFFYMPEDPTPLALPLKVDGRLLAEGFGYSQYPEKQLMLELWPGKANIRPLTSADLHSSTAPNILGGLTEDANKKPKNFVGRTFVGLAGARPDGLFEVVMILTTRTSTQPSAAEVLRSFGAAKVMMLDGGGSAQLICNGKSLIDTGRAIPQVIGVAAAAQAPVQSPPAFQSSAPAAEQSLSVAAPPASPAPARQSSPATKSAPAMKSPAPSEIRLPPSPTPSRIPATATLSDSVPTAAGPAGVTRVPATPSAKPPATGAVSRPTAPPEDSSPAGGVNFEDLLVLPLVMPPVSALILFAVRRRARSF